MPSRDDLTAAEIFAGYRAAATSNRFALRLYSALAARRTGNMLLSPSSIFYALAMAYAGAGGETAREFEAVLGLDTNEPTHQVLGRLQSHTTTGGLKFTIANRVWLQRGYDLRPEFRAVLEECYRAAPAEVDFARDAARACREINDWVAAQTAGKIGAIVDPHTLPPLLRLVLVNAVYFLGGWEDEFDPALTTDDEFQTDDARVPIRMMHRTDRRSFGDYDDCQVLQLPYRFPGFVQTTRADGSTDYARDPNSGSYFAMRLILPRRADGLAALEARLATEGLPDPKTFDARQVTIELPRFRMEATELLGEVLAELGLRRPFDRAAADFSKLSADPEGLFLAAVLHKTFVEVNEKGTEAAAVTALMAAGAACAQRELPPVTFRADRPFLFLIVDLETEMVHFVGRMALPG